MTGQSFKEPVLPVKHGQAIVSNLLATTSSKLSPAALRGSFPSPIKLTFGRRARRLHQSPLTVDWGAVEIVPRGVV
jgi:hypothetical protein